MLQYTAADVAEAADEEDGAEIGTRPSVDRGEITYPTEFLN